MEVVNFVSDIAHEFLQLQVPSSNYNFTFSVDPIEADWHVLYNVRRALLVPNSRARTIFVANEPPEVYRYDPRVLRLCGSVVAPGRYRYLEKSLVSLVVLPGLIPWHVGKFFSEAPLSIEALLSQPPPALEGLSVITSGKSFTPMQRQRLRLLEYLEGKMPYLRLFGQEFSPIKDKHQILCRYQNHLSLENASHPYYWSEKLADGLIMRNRVFQGGDSEAKRYFPGRGVIFINHWDLDKTYKKIDSELENSSYAALSEILVSNRRTVLEDRNLFSLLQRHIDSLSESSPANGAGKSLSLPKHRELRIHRLQYRF